MSPARTIATIATIGKAGIVRFACREEYDRCRPAAAYPDLDSPLEIVSGPRAVRGHGGDELLEIDFLPGGLTAMPGSHGNIVARQVGHHGPVYLLAEDVTVELARRVLCCTPPHGTVGGLETALASAADPSPRLPRQRGARVGVRV